MLGESPAILGVIAEARYVAAADSKGLITGESGVGKELLARFIHTNSPRSYVPMASINCAGVPESLLESELFGHMRGSFTDAHTDRAGLFESSHGGTLLLDEVGEMGARMQALLLRVLENGEIQRIGSDRRRQSVDVRVISATNRDLLQQTNEKSFRLDLYYRLNVVNLIIPPLRERREDIRLLMQHYLRTMSEHFRQPICDLNSAAYSKLEAYGWPGNIRELRNVAERLALQQPGKSVGPDSLPGEIVREVSSGSSEQGAGAVALAQTSVPVAEAYVETMASACFTRMVRGREPFWSVVYEPFMARDLTRDVVRAVISRGLKETRGSYKALAPLFNLQPAEYKRMLTCLQQHDCHLPFQAFRMITDEDRARLAPGPFDRSKVAI